METKPCPKCRNALVFSGLLSAFRLTGAGKVEGNISTYKCIKCGYIEFYEEASNQK